MRSAKRRVKDRMMNDEADAISTDAVRLPGTPPLWLRLIGEAAAMVRFYSRLPLPALGRFDDPANPPPFAHACRMLPVASLLIALPPALALLLLRLTALPTLFGATAAVAVGLTITGALHEDGLADMVDGFGGGRDVAHKLAIMKDSRIGSYGAAALMLSLMARVILLATLVEHSPIIAATGLLAAAILSRTLSLGLFAALPAARVDGVASAIGRPDSAAIAVAGALTILSILTLTVPGFGAGRVFIGLVVAVAVTLGLGRIANHQIGGQTGDVLGAAQVLAEIGFLAGLLAV